MRHAYFRPLLMVGLLWVGLFTGFAWRMNNPPVRWQAVHAAAAAAEQPPPVRSTALAAAAPREAAPHRLAVLLEQATLRLVQQPAPPAPQVRLPATPPAPQPPQPVPGTPTKLGANQWYIIDSDLALVVLTSPPGLVGVGSEAGPIKLRGWFVDAAGVETRTYKGKFIYCLDAAGVGKCELLIIRSDNQEVIRRWLDVDNGGPAPKPPEPPGPVEPTDPLWPALKAAWAQETAADKAKAGSLSSAYRLLASNATGDKTVTTVGALLKLEADTLANIAALKGALAKTRAVIVADVKSKLPTSPAQPLDDATRLLVAGQYARVAALVDALGKLKEGGHH